ncbi:hypothetical protein DSUL_20112 [Desulfovibrionales bacterium]
MPEIVQVHALNKVTVRLKNRATRSIFSDYQILFNTSKYHWPSNRSKAIFLTFGCNLVLHIRSLNIESSPT